MGSAYPSCCKRSGEALRVLFTTSLATLLVRVILIIVFAAYIHELRMQLERYDECLDGGNTEYYCEGKMGGRDSDFQEVLLGMFISSLVIACVWSIVSFVGAYCGYVGSGAEMRADTGTPLQGIVVAEAQAVSVTVIQPGQVLGQPAGQMSQDGQQLNQAQIFPVSTCRLNRLRLK